MLFLDGVYVERPDGAVRFRSLRAPTSAELTHLAHIIAHRVGRFVQRQGLLERDAENSCLAADAVGDEAMNSLTGHSITYRIAIGPHAGRKVFTLQTLPGCTERFDDGVDKVAGFSLHAGVAARANERKKLERLCRYITLGGVKKAPVAYSEWQPPLPAEDAVPGRLPCRVGHTTRLTRLAAKSGGADSEVWLVCEPMPKYRIPIALRKPASL